MHTDRYYTHQSHAHGHILHTLITCTWTHTTHIIHRHTHTMHTSQTHTTHTSHTCTHTLHMSYTSTWTHTTHHTQAHAYHTHITRMHTDTHRTHIHNTCAHLPSPDLAGSGQGHGEGPEAFPNTLTGVTRSVEEAWSRADEAEQRSWTNGRTAANTAPALTVIHGEGLPPGESPLCRGRGWTQHTGAFTPMGTRVTRRGESGAQEHGGEGEWGSRGLWGGLKEGVER